MTRTVLHHNVARPERHFGTVVEFETNRFFENDVVVHRRRAVHPRLFRICPRRKRATDKLVELVPLGCQLHHGQSASTRMRVRGRHARLAPVVREPARVVAAPKQRRRRTPIADQHRRHLTITDNNRRTLGSVSRHHAPYRHRQTLPQQVLTPGTYLDSAATSREAQN